MLPTSLSNAKLVGRVWRPNKGPSVVILRDNILIDVTESVTSMADFLDNNPADLFDTLTGEPIGKVEDLILNPEEMGYHSDRPCLLAPCDFQALKACGVTFAKSMVERVIDERTSGDPARAEELRQRIGALIGGSLSNIQAGSQKAAEVKATLIAEGLWSQYLEVGIGPDAEVFTKSQPMSAVGYGAHVGINRISEWNNPEPEVVLAVDSQGNIRGATLGNDVNLRDVEGRSALLLGKAKDNNASCSIGPFIRLFDNNFTLSDIENATLTMSVKGSDGFTMSGHSNMAEISRKPANLAAQTYNDSHQYPDGFMLFLGTMFAPTQDREGKGSGFTHKPGDVVEISTPLLGTLRNTVVYSDQAAPWTYGTRALMRNLANRGLLS
ncbi:fumarylacetoacetate hydrolase family protein [Acinetobacter baumannii]|uniref:fumarylacetoacetate hydrolase family protein n=1 Tax=Acinetobacter baumannii TaxID=470 RepID=UPI0019007B8B|nr:fumarylacetoacetate hydrolase family protein [Acinetobacter baumannii]MBJ9418445.1 fumarylacetoacetate hydrolase family protein [Acinetobacter baumannii]MDC4955992.1 fumarylacetoacetate hydrolase family protein [Acinetobacter baumannii]MDC5069199.1 fumarylacetoacetate hydrolase family protein [Acinetobacter baumannii]MDN8273113.1 fumarylacetoacetate hydrolase family protein [Acinetobacter baumannii]MDV7599404.1 fumarylacetoacetate hydrolase family protein [Acinetobacter baumannii]